MATSRNVITYVNINNDITWNYVRGIFLAEGLSERGGLPRFSPSHSFLIKIPLLDVLMFYTFCGVGFVEALVSNLGQGGILLERQCGGELSVHCVVVWMLSDLVSTATCGLPSSYWFNFLYGTGVLLLCLIVCLIGASKLW